MVRYYSDLGNDYFSKKKYDISIEYNQKALGILQKSFGGENSYQAQIYYNIGLAFGRKRKIEKAISYYEKALSIFLVYCNNNDNFLIAINYELGKTFHYNREFNKSIEYYKKALELIRKMTGEDSDDIANCYLHLGLCYSDKGLSEKGDFYRAIECYEKALTITKKKYGEKHIYVSPYYIEFAKCYSRNGEFDKAIELYEKALDINIRVYGEKNKNVVDCYTMLSKCYYDAGAFDYSFKYVGKALEINKKMHGEKHPSIAVCYYEIGVLCLYSGSPNNGIEYLEKAKEILHEYGADSHLLMAETYHGLGQMYNCKGDYNKAIEYFEKSMPIFKKNIGDEDIRVGIAYNDLGVIQIAKGEYSKAIENIKIGISICKKYYNDTTPIGNLFLLNLGFAYGEMGAYNIAIETQKKALDFMRRMVGEDSPGLAPFYAGLGRVCLKSGAIDSAIENLKGSLAYLNQSGNYDFNVSVNRLLGIAYLLRHEPKKACEALERGINVLENKHLSINSSKKELRTRYSDTYYLLFQAKIILNDIQAAFTSAEKMKEQGLLDRLSLTSALSINGISKSDRKRMFDLKNRIETLYRMRDRVIDSPQHYSNQNPLVTISNNLRSCEKEFAAIDERLQKNEQYRSLRRPAIATIDEAMVLCGDHGAVLEYFIREDRDPGDWSYKDSRSYCMVIARKGVKIVELGRDFPYTERVDILRTLISYHESVHPSQRFVLGRDAKGAGKLFPLATRSAVSNCRSGERCADLDEKGDGRQSGYLLESDGRISRARWITTGEDRYKLTAKEYTGYRRVDVYEGKERRSREIERLSGELYAALIEPAEKALEEMGCRETNDLIIVPDGSLAFLPFDALRKDRKDKYLFQRYTITMTPSISVLKILRAPERRYSTRWRNELLAFVGPAYGGSVVGETKGLEDVPLSEEKKRELENTSPSDVNIVRKYYLARNITAWPTLSASIVETQSLENLFQSGKKIVRALDWVWQRIVSWFSDCDVYYPFSGVRIFTAAGAQEKKLKELSRDGDLEDYRVVHLSCHGYFAADFPEYSSLVFSETSKSGELKEEEDDGYLTIGEAAALRLKADMVTLSACETGLGTQVAGDGLIGFTRAFQVAGANAVGATLWSVNERETVDFYDKVYREVKEKGCGYREAYARARAWMQAAMDDPYFWSPYVVYGE